MASIRKLPSGKWNAQVRRHGYSPVSKSFLVEKDATRWARNVEASWTADSWSTSLRPKQPRLPMP